VRDSIKHWREHLELLNEKNRRHNEQEVASLRRLGSLAPELERELCETDLSNDGRCICVSSNFTGSHLVQLRQVKTPAQITAECERIELLWPEPQDWPEPEDWAKAEKEIKRAWERRTLYEAAFELMRDDKSVDTENLLLLLFRDERHEMEYKNYWFRDEQEKRLAGR